MNITAKVVNTFREKEHENHIYNAGDVYPVTGYKATDERVKFLSDVHPQLKKIYLADIVREGEALEYPKHVGGGTYELSNGEKVKGKDEAIIAEDLLKQGE
ncbi:MAG: hypothetical protein RR595_09740 [Lysinibacillus sp.]